MKKITLKANAKINLFLDITGKRNDGFHELESVMMSVGIADILTFEKTDKAGIEIICDRDDIPLNDKNIIWKAAKALLVKRGIYEKTGLRVTVKKNIPSQAGMGGGSADGAAALIAVNKLFGLNADESELIEIGAKVGADVPFCIRGGCCVCQGIGEKLSDILFKGRLNLVVIKPDTAISTPAAYKAYDGLSEPAHKSVTQMVTAIESNDTELISERLFNAFDLITDNEEINNAKSALIESGAKGAMMTGSGSAVFGVYESKQEAENAYLSLKDRFKAYLCESENIGVEEI